MIKQFLFAFLFSLIFSVFLISAGVSYPVPISLGPGEKTDFHFAVDAALFDSDLECVIEFDSRTPLEISFHEEDLFIQSGKRIFVEGKISVPSDIDLGYYEEFFCVSCERVSDSSGLSTRPRYCDIPIRVTIGKEPSNFSFTLILVIIIAILLILAFIILKRRMRISKKTPKHI